MDQHMHSRSIDDFRHSHIFLGETHGRNERKTWTVIAICTAMMAAEIVGGLWFGSVALIADGLHMSTHAGALLIAALAYTYSRRYATDERFAFGTGKLGDLAAFTSAIALAMIALLIGYESVDRFFHPVPIAFNQAIPIAVLAFSREAAAAGVSRDTIATAFAGVTQDQAVLAFDRRQRGTFRKSFEDYAATRVTAGRIKRGVQMLQRHAGLFARIERQFGVPGPVIVAIWGLETDFGGDMGKLPTIRVLATMAHDCRRTELFPARFWPRCRSCSAATSR